MAPTTAEMIAEAYTAARRPTFHDGGTITAPLEVTYLIQHRWGDPPSDIIRIPYTATSR